MDIAYGHKVARVSDPYVDLVEAGVATIVRTGTPGAWLVDLLPFCKRAQLSMLGVTNPIFSEMATILDARC